MGIKTLTPATATISPITPVGKDVSVKAFQVARTDTVSSVKAEFPADATILEVVRCGSVASDSATSSTVTLTIANNGGTVSTKGDDVKGSGATTGAVTMSSLPNLEPGPLNGDLILSAVYAEVGASTTGGPWNYLVYYVR